MDHERIDDLLEIWQESFEQGQDIPVEDLCPNEPHLAENLLPHIAALRKINTLVWRVASRAVKTNLIPGAIPGILHRVDPAHQRTR